MPVRRLTLLEPWNLVLETVEAARLADDEVRIRVRSAGVCASDVHGYAGRSSRRQPGTVMGHEVAGEVVELGSGVTSMGVGDRVAVDPVVWCGRCDTCVAGHTHLCRSRRLYGCTPSLPGGFADEIVVRGQNVVPIADTVSFGVASLIEPLSVGLHAAGRAALDEGDSVLVLGGGMIGIATALAASRTAPVVVVEPDEHRRATVGTLGLYCLGPAEVETGAFSVVFDCVGGVGLLDTAIEHAAPRGRVVAVGLAEEEVRLSMSPLVMEERTVIGSAVYTHAEFVATASWAAAEQARLEQVIEADVDLDRLAPAIDALAAGRANAIRTVLTGA